MLQLHKVTENWDCIKLLFNFSGKYKRLYKKNCRRFSKFSDKVKSDKENETKQLLVYATDFCIDKLWNSLIKQIGTHLLTLSFVDHFDKYMDHDFYDQFPLKDTRREKARSNKSPALRKSTKMGVWADGTLNQLFIRGS